MSDLKAEVEAIEYEHWMLLETGRVLRDRWGHGLALVEANAYIESHAIHLRNLIEFLFIKGAGGKLMQADDAVFGAKWNEQM
jgi:hypothetical protein